MSSSKGFIHIGIVVLIVMLVLGIGAFVKKNYLSNKATNQSSDYGFRFDTENGGQFDVSYPSNYFAFQDYQTKAVHFKLASCQEKCETLMIAMSDRFLPDVKEYSVGGKQYALKKVSNSDETTSLALYPKWTNKLGSIEIKSYQNINEPSADFSKIIGSLQFIKEVPAKEIVWPSPAIASSAVTIPQQNIQPAPATPQKVDDFKAPANWKTYEDNEVKIEYPEDWNIRVENSGRIGKIKVVSIHDPSTMEWGYTHTQQSGAWLPTKFVNFNSYDTNTNEIYKSVDKYLDYSSGLYDGRGAKEKYSGNGIEYGFYQIGNIWADFIIISNGKSLTGSIEKKTFETLVKEGFDTKNEEIGIIRSIKLK